MSATKPTILVIEDDPAIRRGVVDALTFQGYRTLQADRGDAGAELALTADYDLIVLDLVLPGCDGLAVLGRVRESRPTTPVILLTARASEQDRVRGLRLGADDYVVKPFSVLELLARIDAVLRRSPGRPEPCDRIELPHATIDLARSEVRHHEGPRHELSARELELLRYLAGHRGRVVSRDELLQNVWRLDPRGLSTRTIDMHVLRLREKLQSPGNEVITTVRGRGYMLAELERASEPSVEPSHEVPS